MTALLEHIVDVDRQATLWLNQLGTPAWDGFWGFMSQNKVWFPFYALVMGILIWKMGWKKGLVVVASLFVTVLLIDQSANLVKESVARLRPFFDPWMLDHGLRVPFEAGGSHRFGFFSAHSANTFGFAVSSSMGFILNEPRYRYRSYTAAVYGWAALVAFSRIILGAHFLVDVLVGAVFGLGVGLAVACATHWIILKAKL